MKTHRILITTADDFGASPEVNDAVVRAHQEGILRFTSLMVDGPAAEDAVAKARGLPGLGVGVHLVLCDSAPASWGLRLVWDRSGRRRMEENLAGQIERFLGFGLIPTHLDSHCHAHVHPAVFPVMARLAQRYGIGRIRWPADELGPSLAYAKTDGTVGYSPLSALRQAALAGTFASLGLCLKWTARGVIMPRCYGLLRSGMMTEDYVLWLLRRLPEGTTEIYFHPSAERDSQVHECPTPTHRSITELGTLLSPRVHQALLEEGIELAGPASGPR